MKSKVILKFLIFIFFNFGIANVFSQQLNYPLEFYYNQIINQRINSSKQIIHSAFKPHSVYRMLQLNISDSLDYKNSRDRKKSESFKNKWVYRKIRTEDFIILQTPTFNLKINPLFNFEWKRDKNFDEKYFINTRGIEFKGDIGSKLSFYSAFYENQAGFEPYISSYIYKTLIVPGQGAAKLLNNNQFDFSRAEAYLSFSPNKYLNFQFGHSKHFIGDGYRSLILSDNSFSYPFFKTTLTFNKIQYVLLWSQYQSFSGAYYNYHKRKYNAISYFSWIPASGFEISLVESIIWPGNSIENNSNFNLNFFNPVILFRSLQYGLNDEKNILLGLNTRIKIYQFAQFFSQFVLDKTDSEIQAQNNYGFQIGIKHFDLFHNKLSNQKLFLHSEYNYIKPYTYTWNDEKQSFTHYNQSIAHPTGTGLKEILGTLRYQYKDLSVSIRGTYIISSIDSLNANFGSDIFKPNSVEEGIISNIGNKPGQGIRNELVHINSELSFLINPATNMQMFLGLHFRKNMNYFSQTESLYFSFGIKTNLSNYYYDF
jgi:hypothetical protein